MEITWDLEQVVDWQSSLHLLGFVGKQNIKYRLSANLQKLQVYSPKLTVLFGITVFGIVGPYLFVDNKRETVAVNSGCWNTSITLWNGFRSPSFSAGGGNSPHHMKQCGCCSTVVQIYYLSFWWLTWPSQSPHVNIHDFLWESLKDHVCQRCLMTIQVDDNSSWWQFKNSDKPLLMKLL